MLVEIDRAKFERQWLLPKLEKYLIELEKREKLEAIEKVRLFAESLIIRGKEPVYGLSHGRHHFAREGFLLSCATTTQIRPELMFRNLKFGRVAQEILDIQFEHQQSLVVADSPEIQRRAAPVYAIPLKDENQTLISDSNYNELFQDYLNRVRQAVREVRERVENDVVIEDIIFE